MESLFNKVDKNRLTIIYKLLYDALFISLLFFFLALIAEGVLPGIVTAHIGFTKMIFTIFVIIFGIYILGDHLKISPASSNLNKKTAAILLLIFVLLIFNSLIKLNIFLNIFILLVVAAIGYFIYKNILEE